MCLDERRATPKEKKTKKKRTLASPPAPPVRPDQNNKHTWSCQIPSVTPLSRKDSGYITLV